MIALANTHIVRDPGKRGGKRYIAGTGITVQHIAELHNLGWTVKDLMEEFELTAGQAYAALSYYADHQGEIDRAIHEAVVKVQNLGTSMEAWKHQIESRQASQ